MFNLKLYKKFLPQILSTILTVFIPVEAAIHLVHKQQQETVFQTVRALFRINSTTDHPYEIIQSLSNLELTGTISCLRVYESQLPGRPFLDTSFRKECNSSLLNLRQTKVAQTIETLNGIHWRIEYSIIQSSVVNILSWLVRALALALAALAIYLLSTIARHQEQRAQLQAAQSLARANLASQVAHDIRSPLAALELALKTLNEIPEEKRLLVRSALSRIHDIANNLLQTNRPTPDKAPTPISEPNGVSATLLSTPLDSLVSEKRMQFRERLGVEIDLNLGSKAYGIFANVNTTEFGRVISNLVNNAVESLNTKGRVTISLSEHNGDAIISIADTGKGIPPEILARLGQRGETHGKEGGSGLGLYHARTTSESWGGRLQIDSDLGFGTTVTIKLPLAQPPAWFVEKLKMEPSSKIVILDDDSSIHRIWEGRFASARLQESGIEVLHFSTPTQCKEWVQANSSQNTLFLVDYELLGFSESGLDLIESLGIQKQSILVTSRFEEPQIRTRCERLEIRLIPKAMAAYVPIETEAAKVQLDAILIDDDKLVHATWQMAAQQSQKRIEVFESPEGFFKTANLYARNTPVYVDVNLAGNLRGETIAQRIHELGFTNIWLATGYEEAQLAKPAFIRGIQGKAPPF